MSVTEIVPRNDDFERTPPHDVAAEQCVLGGMLLSKDAISDVIEVIRPADHYRPAHQLIHEAILDLYSRGEPADAITVANELTRRAEIARVGGAPYLHTLISSVPTAANAGYYARIVRERAILRRLVEAGTRIVQFGYAGEADADELVDRAQAEVYAVTERRASEDYHSLSEIMPGALDEIEAIGSHNGMLTGVPTGFADLDALTNGLHPSQMVVIAARPAMGKALALDTPLPTPAGWTTMGEVQVGDHLIGADGHPTRVVAATEVLHGRPCYEVEFSGGDVIVADENHQWLTWSHPAGDLVPPQVVTTAEIRRTLRCEPELRRSNHAVAMTAPIRLTGVAAEWISPPPVLRRREPWQYVMDVRPAQSRPVRCVQVDSADHLYLAGRGMLPTHNSTLALDFARAAAIRHSMATVLFSLEMGRNEITMRLLSAEARVPLQTMRTGQMNDDDWARLARRMSEVADAPLFIDDSPNMSMMEIRAKCRRLKQRHDLKFVIVDYLQLMSSPRRVENRQQEVSDLSRSLKLLAKELELPVVALSQLNRGSEQRTDKKPMLSDLRESRLPDRGHDAHAGRYGRAGFLRRADPRRLGRGPGLVGRRAASAGSRADHQRLRLRHEGGVPAAAGLRPRGQGVGQSPLPHPRRLAAPGGSGRRRPPRHPAPQPRARRGRSWLVGAPAGSAGPSHRRRLRPAQPAPALHVQRRGEPGLRGGRGGRRVRHLTPARGPEDLVAHLPARAVPLHPRSAEPAARLVPRARDRRSALV